MSKAPSPAGPIRRLFDFVQWHRTHWVKLDPRHQDALLGLFTLLQPLRAKGMRKIRIGENRDGGYVMLDDFAGIDMALSLGIGPNVSWDRAVAERGMPVRQFDHTVSGPPQDHPLFQFEAKKVVPRRNSSDEVTLPSLLAELEGNDLLLKMDIEGDEWKVLADLPVEALAPCRQIVMELHDFGSIGDAGWAETARQVLSRLTKDFAVVHVHGNNLSRHLLLKDHCLPDCLEVTFANRRFYDLAPTDEVFPGVYDKKNNPFFPDFRLGRFQFERE